MCPGREIGLNLVVCLGCNKFVVPLPESEQDSYEKSERFCHCDELKMKYIGKGYWEEWEPSLDNRGDI